MADKQRTDVTTTGDGISPSLPVDHASKHIEQVDAVEKVHLDGTVDLVDKRAVGGDLEYMPKGYFYSARFIGTLVAACLGLYCVFIYVMVATSLALINEALGPSPHINWVSTAWLLGCAVGFLIFGRLSDIFGRKWLVIGSSSASLIGYIIAAVAPNVNTLIGANMLVGIGAAAQSSFSVFMGELVPNKFRGPTITVIFLSSVPICIFGPVFARLLVLNTAAGWRWNFYLGIICSGLSVTLYIIFYHPPKYAQLHVHGITPWQQFRALDFGGLFLFVAGLVLFLTGLSWGGQQYPWTDVKVLCTLILGGLTLVAFGFYEQYVVKKQALMPLRLFKTKGYVALLTSSTIATMVFYSMTILLPAILQTVYGANVLTIGWQSCATTGGILLGQTAGGIGLTYLPKVKWQAIINAIVVLAFTTCLATIHAGGSGHIQVVVLTLLATTGVGWIDTIANTGVTFVVEPQDIGLAAGLYGCFRSVGGAVAQALYVSIYTNKVTTYIPTYVSPAAIQAGLPESSITSLFAGIATGNFSAVPGITSKIITVVVEEVQRAYMDSFRMLFYATIPFSVITVVCAFFVPNFDKYLHSDVARKLQHVGKGEQHVEQGEQHVEKGEQHVEKGEHHFQET